MGCPPPLHVVVIEHMRNDMEPEIVVLKESKDVIDSASGIIRVESILTSRNLYFDFFFHDSEEPFSIHDFTDGSPTYNEMLMLMDPKNWRHDD